MDDMVEIPSYSLFPSWTIQTYNFNKQMLAFWPSYRAWQIGSLCLYLKTQGVFPTEYSEFLSTTLKIHFQTKVYNYVDLFVLFSIHAEIREARFDI